MTSLSGMLAGRKAVLFDFFHTLTGFESEWSQLPSTSEYLGVDRRLWNKHLLESFPDRLTGRLKDSFAIIRALADLIDPSIPDEKVRGAVENRVARFEHSMTNLPASNVETLKRLKLAGKKLALVSNADVMEITAWDRSPAAPWFDSVLFSCEVGLAKPDERIYRLALERLEVEAGEAVFVGDGGSDELLGARGVGLATVMMAGVAREFWPERIESRKDQADYIIEEIAELAAGLD